MYHHMLIIILNKVKIRLIEDRIYSGGNHMENFDSSDNRNKKASLLREVLSWLAYLGGAVLIALFINNFVIVNAFIPTESMANTIMPRDRFLDNRLPYHFSDPQRGDIVVFKFPDNEEILYVKRVIGLPGETVEIKDGQVYVDGRNIDEPYIRVTTEGNFGPYNVPEGNYFMMGDNRNNSLDSRRWNNTYVERKKISGKVFLEYFPRIKVF